MYSLFQRAPIYLLSVTVNHLDLNIFDFSFKVGRELDDSVGWWQILTHNEPDILRRFDEKDLHLGQLVCILGLFLITFRSHSFYKSSRWSLH